MHLFRQIGLTVLVLGLLTPGSLQAQGRRDIAEMFERVLGVLVRQSNVTVPQATTFRLNEDDRPIFRPYLQEAQTPIIWASRGTYEVVRNQDQLAFVLARQIEDIELSHGSTESHADQRVARALELMVNAGFNPLEAKKYLLAAVKTPYFTATEASEIRALADTIDKICNDHYQKPRSGSQTEKPPIEWKEKDLSLKPKKLSRWNPFYEMLGARMNIKELESRFAAFVENQPEGAILKSTLLDLQTDIEKVEKTLSDHERIGLRKLLSDPKSAGDRYVLHNIFKGLDAKTEKKWGALLNETLVTELERTTKRELYERGLRNSKFWATSTGADIAHALSQDPQTRIRSLNRIIEHFALDWNIADSPYGKSFHDMIVQTMDEFLTLSQDPHLSKPLRQKYFDAAAVMFQFKGSGFVNEQLERLIAVQKRIEKGFATAGYSFDYHRRFPALVPQTGLIPTTSKEFAALKTLILKFLPKFRSLPTFKVIRGSGEPPVVLVGKGRAVFVALYTAAPEQDIVSSAHVHEISDKLNHILNDLETYLPKQSKLEQSLGNLLERLHRTSRDQKIPDVLVRLHDKKIIPAIERWEMLKDSENVDELRKVCDELRLLNAALHFAHERLGWVPAEPMAKVEAVLVGAATFKRLQRDLEEVAQEHNCKLQLHLVRPRANENNDQFFEAFVSKSGEIHVVVGLVHQRPDKIDLNVILSNKAMVSKLASDVHGAYLAQPEWKRELAECISDLTKPGMSQDRIDENMATIRKRLEATAEHNKQLTSGSHSVRPKDILETQKKLLALEQILTLSKKQEYPKRQRVSGTKEARPEPELRPVPTKTLKDLVVENLRRMSSRSERLLTDIQTILKTKGVALTRNQIKFILFDLVTMTGRIMKEQQRPFELALVIAFSQMWSENYLASQIGFFAGSNGTSEIVKNLIRHGAGQAVLEKVAHHVGFLSSVGGIGLSRAIGAYLEGEEVDAQFLSKLPRAATPNSEGQHRKTQEVAVADHTAAHSRDLHLPEVFKVRLEQMSGLRKSEEALRSLDLWHLTLSSLIFAYIGPLGLPAKIAHSVIFTGVGAGVLDTIYESWSKGDPDDWIRERNEHRVELIGRYQGDMESTFQRPHIAKGDVERSLKETIELETRFWNELSYYARKMAANTHLELQNVSVGIQEQNASMKSYPEKYQFSRRVIFKDLFQLIRLVAGGPSLRYRRFPRLFATQQIAAERISRNVEQFRRLNHMVEKWFDQRDGAPAQFKKFISTRTPKEEDEAFIISTFHEVYKDWQKAAVEIKTQFQMLEESANKQISTTDGSEMTEAQFVDLRMNPQPLSVIFSPKEQM